MFNLIRDIEIDVDFEQLKANIKRRRSFYLKDLTIGQNEVNFSYANHFWNSGGSIGIQARITASNTIRNSSILHVSAYSLFLPSLMILIAGVLSFLVMPEVMSSLPGMVTYFVPQTLSTLWALLLIPKEINSLIEELLKEEKA